MKAPEILAPAGSPESLKAALRTGADAVYVGGKSYSARNNAANFTDEELAEGIRQCHSHGAKLYLAVNTIISDDESADFCGFIKSAAAAGVDGFIVQDWGAAKIIRQAVPDAVIHASTQMSVHTAAGVRLLREMGYVRAVPARELSRDALKRLCAEDIETEVFVHGALCMSVSGQCYMSAMIGSRSANRGCCGQACRLPFSAAGKCDYAALSLKDLSLLEKLDDLAEMGLDSLKIEGRMKRPEYIAAAVSELRRALNGEIPDMQMLRGVFSRGGFTNGYFSGDRRDMFGVREHEDVLAAKGIFPKLHELYRSERAAYTADLSVRIKAGEPVDVTAVCGDISASVQGDIPDAARNAPTDTAAVAKQFSKLGDTVFTLGSLDADIGGGLFVPAGKLNELRRRVMDELTERIIFRNTPKYTITDYIPQKTAARVQNCGAEMPLYVFCRTTEQAVAASALARYVAVPEKLITPPLLDAVPPEKIIVSPPRFVADEDKTISRLTELRKLGLSRLMCHTPDHIAIGKQLGYAVHGSFTLNLFNSESAEVLRNIGLEDCLVSVECTLEQIGGLRSEMPLGAVIYGRLPLMLTRNCPIKNEVGCERCTGALSDRTSRRFPVACSGDYVEILNSDVLYMSDRLSEMRGISYGAVLLTDEDHAGTIAAISGKKPSAAVTRGLYYRGVH